ncbi:MAG: hypothetical protein H7Y11_01535, partial [Armatimonadetes bacterium]|nr:hypothetical protein [Anaerolineae bacterium]
NSIAVDGGGGTALIGAPYDIINENYAQGSAYVFDLP